MTIKLKIIQTLLSTFALVIATLFVASTIADKIHKKAVDRPHMSLMFEAID